MGGVPVDGRVAIVGGDKRSVELDTLLTNIGYQPRCFLKGKEEDDLMLEYIAESEIIVLPVNYLGGDTIKGTVPIQIETVLKHIAKDAILFCGKSDELVRRYADLRGFSIKEWIQDEPFLISNAYLSAEGAIASAISNSARSLMNAQCAVIGSGRLAFAMIHLLRAFTPSIRLTARNPGALEEGKRMGCTTFMLDEMEYALCGAEYVFNTVPQNIISASAMRWMAPRSLYIEMASKPYGCIPEDVPEQTRYLLEPGIPGRMCPFAAAELMAECMERTIKERWGQ